MLKYEHRGQPLLSTEEFVLSSNRANFTCCMSLPATLGSRNDLPAAVPLMFIVGPPEGCLSAPPTFLPSLPNPSMRPQEVVLLPSPRGICERDNHEFRELFQR